MLLRSSLQIRNAIWRLRGRFFGRLDAAEADRTATSLDRRQCPPPAHRAGLDGWKIFELRSPPRERFPACSASALPKAPIRTPTGNMMPPSRPGSSGPGTTSLAVSTNTRAQSPVSISSAATGRPSCCRMAPTGSPSMLPRCRAVWSRFPSTSTTARAIGLPSSRTRNAASSCSTLLLAGPRLNARDLKAAPR